MSSVPVFVFVRDNKKSSTTCKGGIAPFLLARFGSAICELTIKR